RRARTFGGPGAGSRRARRRSRVPAACRHAHRRPGAARRARRGCGPGEPSGRRARRDARAAGHGGRPGARRGPAPRVGLVRAHVAFASGLAGDAPPLLLKAARQLEAFDLDLARETYLTAWAAAGMAGSLAGRTLLLEICRAIRALPPSPGEPRPLD